MVLIGMGLCALGRVKVGCKIYLAAKEYPKQLEVWGRLRSGLQEVGSRFTVLGIPSLFLTKRTNEGFLWPT
ncbi:MAG: hypothetical protein ACJAX1_002242 [Neolewinella sp.]|jgi:hypothetical protein